MAPPPHGAETPSSVGNDDKTKKTPQGKDDDKFKRVIQKRRKLLKDLRRRSTIKRKLIAKEWGVVNSSKIRQRLFCRRELEEIERLKYRLNPHKHRVSRPRTDTTTRTEVKSQQAGRGDADTYKTSNVFLKGTQSANPHNDYSQHFVDTGQRPQNFIRDTGMHERFEEYPKLKELIRLKNEQIRNGATLPMYMKCDLSTFDLSSLGCKFDVILIEPPLEEYQRRTSGITYSWEPWDFEEIMNLKIEDVAAPRSFVFLWCGSYEGLDHGRECLRKWGFRRCEDICWVKTNISNPGNTTHREPRAVFQTTKEHCLMGIRGTVRRNQDGHFIHANVDLDIITTEEPEIGSTEKPEEIYHMIEHFCLGRRRLHLFGGDSTIRPGWLTLGPSLSSSNFHKETYQSFFEGDNSFLLPQKDEIENLRPKTPPPKGRGIGRGSGGPPPAGMGRGGGAVMGRGYPV